MKRVASKFFFEIDLFSIIPTLRFRLQPYAATPGLGLFSLLLLGYFIYILVNNLIQISQLDESQITVTQSYTTSNSIKNISNLMFAISFLNDGSLKNVLDYERLFMMTAKIKNQTVNLAPCKPQQWKLLGEDYVNKFQKQLLKQAYCPQDSINITAMSGQVYLRIYLSKCDSKKRTNCRSDKRIKRYFEQIIGQHGSFPVWVHFLAPYPQVKSIAPLKYNIQNKRFAAAVTQTSQYFIKLNQFNINTNKNIWPLLQTKQSQTGFQSAQIFYAYKSFNLVDEVLDVKNSLIIVNCFISQNVKNYDRRIGKVDQVLSYVGGLFGVIGIVLFFFINKYNEYKYELRVSQSTFNFDANGHKKKQNDLNILTYVLYSIYNWTQLIFNYKLPWTHITQISQTLEESRNLLNVQKLFRRLEYLQDVVWSNVNPDLLRSLSLEEPKSLQQAQNSRRILQYYQHIIKYQKAKTVKDAIDQNMTALKYLGQIYKMNQKAKNQSKAIPASIQQLNPQVLKNIDVVHDQTEQEIYQSLILDLELENYPQLCQNVSYYVMFAKQAKQHILDPQFIQIQKIIVKAFLSIPQKAKANLIMKIPIKILHRLRFCARQMNKDKPRKQFKSKIKRQISEVLSQISNIE